MSLLAYCFSRLTKSEAKNELKGFKVTDVNRKRKFGVACRNLQELKSKACKKLNITINLTDINIYLLDGSLVDEEYFHTLEPQTTLILQKPGEKLTSDADLLYQTLKQVNINYLTVGDLASKFLSEKLKRKVAILHDILNRDDSKTAFSKQEDHPEWFKGLETNVTTKEAYMHRRCQDRIRSYLYKTIEQIKMSDTWINNHQARIHLHRVIEYFRVQLKEDHYFGYYFDRSYHLNRNYNKDSTDGIDVQCYDHCPCKIKNNNVNSYEDDNDETDAKRLSTEKTSPTKRLAVDEKEICPYTLFPGGRVTPTSLCNSLGEFKCNGTWNEKSCTYQDEHKINPYRSHEELILFSTWNLDHKIERSRTLIPQLLKYSEEGAINENIVLGLYDNLFTVKNLRLVHIVCHDKTAHK